MNRRPSQSRRRSEKGANKEEKKHKKGKKGKTAWNSAVPEVQDLSDYEVRIGDLSSSIIHMHP